MSNAQWGRDWYEAPTEIVRGGKPWYFAASAQEIRGQTKKALTREAKELGLKYRFIWNRRNHEYGMWIDRKPKYFV